MALKALPKKSKRAPVRFGETHIENLPLIKSWPKDGGAFVTMPQVYTESPGNANIMQSNVGMYRIQLSGNQYVLNDEVGMHYQLHRGIGVHHTAYNQSELPFRATVAIGGPPSFALSAIFPLPEGLSEVTFAGMLGNRRFRYHRYNGTLVPNDADFVITGTIMKHHKKPEGPFGDHLGYYSLEHPFPLMKVDKVFHRKNPLWHFSVVGRPPQEDSYFGYLIHKIVGDLVPNEFPGVHQIHAVDEAGVHPLLLAIGSERYMPFRTVGPEEILIQANRILGSGQTSLAKFLWIANIQDNPNLDTHNYADFYRHMLERVQWDRDLHFQTKTTIDTLDYSGSGWNAGSKVVIAARGPAIRSLSTLWNYGGTLTTGVKKVKVVAPGILAIEAQHFQDQHEALSIIDKWIELCKEKKLHQGFPLMVLCDDAPFLAANWANFLWVTFTRANPSHDIYGIDAFIEYKHWGCKESLIIDARIKPHHAPVLEVDPVARKKANDVIQRTPELKKLL